jgi:hypothetical protein
LRFGGQAQIAPDFRAVAVEFGILNGASRQPVVRPNMPRGRQTSNI